VLGKGNVIAPTGITLPLASVAAWEKYEGMLVRFSLALTVAQNYFLGRFGQLTLSGSRMEVPTNRYRPRSSAAIALRASNNANFVVLDDASSSQNPNPIPYIGIDNTVRSGDTVSGLTGVIDFGSISSTPTGAASYKLQPTIAPVFSRKNVRTTAPAAVGGNVKVASFNVLNFFSTFTNGLNAEGQTTTGCKQGSVVSKTNCRGADNLTEFNRQRAKIVAAMKAIDADVFGLMEMQNNGNTAIAYLVNSLNTLIGSNTYAYLPVPTDPTATGDDAIRLAIIYKPAKLVPVGAPMTDINPVNSRPPLAQTFRASTGKRFSLIVNHFKSKGSCPTDGSLDTDQGDGQGCWNALRTAQATRLLSFISQVQTAAADTDVLVIGDFNAYGAEDPIFTLQNGGLVNQIERFVRPRGMPYSYVFDGESGYLDNALATSSLSAKVTGVSEWHINADEPTVIDYNTEFRVQDLYTASQFRSSDHDPVVIGLNLPTPALKLAAPKRSAPPTRP
jgi:predicted extracellular nuclease